MPYLKNLGPRVLSLFLPALVKATCLDVGSTTDVDTRQ